MQTLRDQLPRVFQANIVRLYGRLVRPGMERLPTHSDVVFGLAPTLDAFLVRATEQVDNHTANEAAKAFALTLAAVFERQLRAWVRALVSSGAAPAVGSTAQCEKLLKLIAIHAGLDLAALGLDAVLAELLLVGNVVRHGDGSSCERLRALAPVLWVYEASEYVDIASTSPPISESMRIRDVDLARYVRAIARFWGHADPLPMASLDVVL